MRQDQILPIEDKVTKTLSKLSSNLDKYSAEHWIARGERQALDVFHEASSRVPAYKDFLKKEGIKPQGVTTFGDLTKVPWTDKENYITQYSLEQLSWDGKLDKANMVNSSSGTTGKSLYWSCGENEILNGAYIHEYLFENYYDITNNSTLVIICFGMGTWVAGTYTLLSTYLISRKRNNLSIITPGFDKKEVLRILFDLAPKYNQVLIIGYPTFVKDVLEDYRGKGPKLNMKYIFAGEGYSESWRNYLMTIANTSPKSSKVMGILGSADAAIMGFETDSSIRLRKLVSENRNLTKCLFGEERVPFICNYIPEHRYFEEIDKELVFTANRAIPLVRYNIHDYGGILNINVLKNLLKQSGINYLRDHQLPLLYVFGRGRFTATIFAANIYPENVRDALSDRVIRRIVTGGFSLKTKYDKKHNQYLLLTIELVQGIRKSSDLKRKIADAFVRHVTKVNSEYNRIYCEYGTRVRPKVVLIDSKYSLDNKDKVKKSS